MAKLDSELLMFTERDLARQINWAMLITNVLKTRACGPRSLQVIWEKSRSLTAYLKKNFVIIWSISSEIDHTWTFTLLGTKVTQGHFWEVKITQCMYLLFQSEHHLAISLISRKWPSEVPIVISRKWPSDVPIGFYLGKKNYFNSLSRNLITHYHVGNVFQTIVVL
jgi:hypothetical protein